MKRRKLIFVIFIFFYLSPTYSQYVTDVSKVGTTSAAFLEFGVGARAVGMGGAFVAIADDANALYWNPSGIARIPRREVTFVHTEWLADTDFDFAGIVLPLGTLGTLGASITTLNMGEMKVRTVFEPEGTGEMFDASDLALALSFARNLTDRFSIGFSTKYIKQSIWHMTASSVAIDVGTLFTTQFNNMKIGMSISNFGNKMKLEGKDTRVYHDIDPVKYGNNEKINALLETERWSLPLIFRVGIAMDILRSKYNRLTIATDALHPNDNYESVNIGIEYAFNNLCFLRFGYKSLFLEDSKQGLTAGAGLNYNLKGVGSLKVDYAYADFGIMHYTQRFSFGIEF